LNQSTKQRIVGTVVLLVAALILLPVIFDGDGSYQTPLESRIPTPPPFPEPARVIPDRPVVIADTEQINLAPAADSTDSNMSTDSNDSAADSSDQASDVEPATTASTENDTSAETAAVSTAAASANLQLDNQGLPQGWSVRMGAFSVISNAEALVQELQAKELRAYSRSILVNNAPMAVVYIGPLIDRTAAQQLLEEMNRDYAQLPGKRIERFEIEGL
jgi:DedD protein